MDKKHIPFWLIISSLFILLILPNLLQDGMFMDGLLYAAISKNMAHNIGSFWFPQISKTFCPSFHEHPPLAFGIQSLFFKLFGDHLLVERLYSFITAIITGCFIVLLWKHIFKHNTDLRKLAWLPFLFWFITPLTFWSYSNNMLENTMGVFTIAAVYVLLKGLSKPNTILLSILLAGILIFLASLCKGFVALFPLIVIGCYTIIFKNMSLLKMSFYSLLLALIPVIILLLLFIDNDIYQSLFKYFSTQVMGSLTGKRVVMERHFILIRLFNEMLPILIITLLALLIFKIKKINSGFTQHLNWAIFFLLIGISASFPIMISPKQSGFYLVPSYPYFAIGFAILIANGITESVQKINTKSEGFHYFRIIATLLFAGSIIFSFLQKEKTSRDKEMLQDVYAIGSILPKGTIINICPSIYSTWALHGYFARYFYISLDASEHPHEYFLDDNKCKSELLSSHFIPLNLSTTLYTLYKKGETDFLRIQQKTQDSLTNIKEKFDQLQNIYFPFNSSYYHSKDTLLLNQMVDLLLQYPNISITIKGHSDRRGDYKYNQWLSEQRANRIKDYLLSKGISEDRLTLKGVGEEEFAIDCKVCNEYQHQQNRRAIIQVSL